MLLFGALLTFLRTRTVPAFLQLLGAASRECHLRPDAVPLGYFWQSITKRETLESMKKPPSKEPSSAAKWDAG
jgi:hypothetical protein